MENLTKNGGCHVMAGNKRLLIADISEVQSIDFTDFNSKTVTMRSGCGFAEIFGQSIRTEVTENGGAFTHETTCRLTGTKQKYDRLLADMVRGGWIAKIVDNTDTVWLSGSKEEPLHFSFRHIGAAEASGEHLYELTFHRDMTEPLCATTL
ncbi:MAG: hypothetical protein II899_05845 [Bacteroidales bacterium]|nr:hypothetical protein [Bacteroidales bacterium]